MVREETMLKMFVKKFSVLFAFFLFCVSFLHAQHNDYYFDVWTWKNLIKNPSANVKASVKKYIPSGYQLDVLYMGDVNDDDTKDYALVLLPDSFKRGDWNNSCLQIAERPINTCNQQPQ